MRAEEQSDISNIKKDIRTQLNATIKGSGAGFDAGVNRQQGSDREDRYSQQAEISRTSIETQGGNGLRASRYALMSGIASLIITTLTSG